MSVEQRILRRQGMKQARAWLEEQPGRVERFLGCLERGETEQLKADLQQMGSSPYLDRLRKDPENLLEALRSIAELPPPSEGFLQGRRAELHYRAIKISDGLYRSCQPRLKHLRQLVQDIALTRVVNLREECEHSRELCEELGLDYLYLSVPDHKVPTLEQVEEFLEILDSRPTLVHCHAGRGRTGIFVACYRIRVQGLSALEALRLTEGEVQPIRPNQRAWVKQFYEL